MKIKKALMDLLFEKNIRIENVFYMQLVRACDYLPESFWEVYDENSEEVMRAIGHDSYASELFSQSELLEFLHAKNCSGVLVQFATPTPRNFQFTEGGDFISCSHSWGMATWSFAHGQTLDEALIKAITIRNDDFLESFAQAKLSQSSYHT
ncbi:hypothetical protein OIX85_003890 [Vibrio parahaemolyticus]|uniref:hypothetical protein n=1 Tax=Vibrio alginolyticus TaxID=663 RepID=UPI0035C6F48B|nr:hypothetical protein [Vibrio parahaemolyticus]